MQVLLQYVVARGVEHLIERAVSEPTKSLFGLLPFLARWLLRLLDLLFELTLHAIERVLYVLVKLVAQPEHDVTDRTRQRVNQKVLKVVEIWLRTHRVPKHE